jgi:hypothetical protein
MALFHQQPLQNLIQQQSLTGNPVFIKLFAYAHVARTTWAYQRVLSW